MSLLVAHVNNPYTASLAVGLARRGVRVGDLVGHGIEDFAAQLEAGGLGDVPRLDADAFRDLDRTRSLVGPDTAPLEVAHLEALEGMRLGAYANTDRIMHTPQSFRWRKRLIRAAATVFLTRLRVGEIDRVLLPAVPHHVWDQVLFAIARVEGVRVRILSQVHLDDRVFLHDEFQGVPEVGPLPPDDRDDDALLAELAPEIQDCFTRGDRGTAKTRARWAMAQARLADEVEQDAEEVQAAQQGSLGTRLRRRATDAALVALGPLFTLADRLRDGPLFWARLRAHRHQLRRAYDRLAGPVPDDAPFVYLALHRQPEQTTVPKGGLFEDQLVVARTLAAALPEGWRLYVREHPAQLNLDHVLGDWRTWRDPSDYEDLARVARTRLVSMDEEPHDLIRRAEVVATVTGTSAWEALQLGTPSMVFAPTWFSGSPGCYLVDSVEAARAALEDAQRWTPEAVRRGLLRYLHALQPHLTLGCLNPEWHAASARPLDELTETTVELLASDLGSG